VQGILSIHLAVVLFGASGLFGKLISAPAGVLVFGRTFFAAVVLLVAMVAVRQNMLVRSLRDVLSFLFLGVLLALHWVSFFHSIQVSTVAIGLLTFSTFPLFVTFLEPLFFNEKLRGRDAALALIVFSGLVLVIPDFDLSNTLTRGAVWGTVSGLTFALLSLSNRKLVKAYAPLTVAVYQNSAASMLLLPFVYSTLPLVPGREWGLLIILGVVFTAVAHTLFIRGLVGVKAQLAALIACLEPVYGIGFSVVLLGEIPTVRELIGGVIIISGVLLASRKSTDT